MSADVTAPRPRRGVMRERSRRRKLLLLVLLLLLLAALGYSAYYFMNNKRLPLPGPRAGETIDPPQYLFSITGGSGSQALEKPTGVVVSPSGRVFVTDVTLHRIRIFDLQGRSLGTIQKIADGTNSMLVTPVHLAVSPDREVYVTDRKLNAIYIFDENGKYLRKFQPQNPRAVKGWTPLAVAFDPEGNLFVTDVGKSELHRVLAFDPSGKLLAAFGQTAQAAAPDQSTGSFFFPNGLVVIRGKLFVSDGDNRRVQVFDKKGTFAYLVGTSGVPRGLTVDAKGHLYVVDALAHQVDIYTPEGKLLTTFGQNGVGPGQFNYPNDISIASNQRIYIADRENKQVQVWGYPASTLPTPSLPDSPLQWMLCLAPLLLLLVPLLRRRRTFVVTPSFVDGMVAAEAIGVMDHRRFRWVLPEAEYERFAGRVEAGVDLGQLLVPEPFSPADAADIEKRLEIAPEAASVLSMARRDKRLATEDSDLRQLALLLEVDVYSVAEFLDQYGPKDGRA